MYFSVKIYNSEWSKWYSQCTTKVKEYILHRQHVSALVLDHHQVYGISKETIRCSIYVCNINQRDLVGNMATDHCREKRNKYYKRKIRVQIKESNHDTQKVKITRIKNQKIVK
jgi:hypothetical protein